MVDGLERDFEGRLQVVVLDFDDPPQREAALALGAAIHPTVVLVDAEGAVVDRLLGPQDDDDLRPKVRALVD